MATGLQNIEWSMQTGFNAREERDKSLVTQSNETIDKINTLVDRWREAQAKIKAAIKTYQKYVKPDMQRLEEEIKGFKATLQPLVNETYLEDNAVLSLVRKIQKRVVMDPSKSTANAAYFKPILEDLALMNIPTKGIATQGYEQFHQDTLALEKSKATLNSASVNVRKVEAEVQDNLNLLRSGKDNHGTVHYRTTYVFWKGVGAVVRRFSEKHAFYQYQKMNPEALVGNVPEKKQQKKAKDGLLALKIPPFKEGHEKRENDRITSLGIKKTLAATKKSIHDVKRRLEILMTPKDETEGEVVRNSDDSYEKLHQEYTELYKKFVTFITNYHLVKKKLPKKLQVVLPYNAATIIVTLGYLSKEEIRSCYHEYNLNRDQFEANLNAIEATIKELKPVFEEVESNLSLLKNAMDRQEAKKDLF